MAFGNMLNKLGNAANKGADLLGKANDSIAELQAKAVQKVDAMSDTHPASEDVVNEASADTTVAPTAIEFEPITLAPWEPAQGEARRFGLNGEFLDVDESMDAYNVYRQRFHDYAKLATDANMEAFSANVHDLQAYLSIFPSIYEQNLEAIANRAVDALVSAGIFTVTVDVFKEHHMAKFHSFGDIQATITDGIEQAAQANRQAVEGIANLVMRSSSSGGLLSDALYGVRDAYKSNLIDNAAKISPEQAKKLFELIKPDALAAVVFADYWSVHLTLVNILIEEGRQIWWPSDDETQRAQSVFQNLTNPNFPQDQITPAFIQILKTNPYRKEYHQYMVNNFGENDETLAVRSYFGFSDLSDQRLG